MKRRHNRLVILIVMMMALLYVGNILIDNPYTHSLFNYYLNERILKDIPIRAEYQSLKIELLPPSVKVYGLQISALDDNNQPVKLAALSTLVFRASPWSIFMARPQIGDLELKDLNAAWPPPPEILEKLSKLGKTDEPTKPSDPVWPPTSAPPISSLKISNASITAALSGISLNAGQDKDEITRIQSDGLNAHLEIHDWKSFKIELSSGVTSITDRSSSYFENGSLKLRGEMRNRKFATRKLEVRSPRLDLNGKIDSEIITAKNSNVIESVTTIINGDTVQGDMSILGSFLNIAGNRGRFSARTATRVKIPVTSKQPLDFTTSGHLKSHDARFYDFRLYETESDFTIDLNKLQLSNTDIMLDKTSVAKGGGSILFDKAITYDFKLEPTRLPLKDLLGIFNINFDSVNFDLTSPLLAITGTGDPFKMSVTSAATLTNFTTPPADYDHSLHPESPQCNLDLSILVNSQGLTFNNGSGKCHITGRDTKPGSFPLNVTGFTSFNSKQGMDLSLRSDAFNPAPLTYFAQAGLDGTGEMTTRIHGPYDAVAVDVVTSIRNLVIGSTAVGTLGAGVQISGDKVSWQNIEVKTPAGGSVISKAGTLTLNDDLDIDFDLSARMIDHGLVGSATRDLSGGKSSAEFVVKSLDSRLRGPATLPLRWQGTVDIDIENARDRDFVYAKSVKGSIKGSKTGYSAEGITAILAGTQASINFSHTWAHENIKADAASGLGISQNDKIDIAAKFSAIPNAGDDIKLFPIIGKVAAEQGISTQLSGDAKFGGTLSRLSGIARIQMTKTRILNAPVSDLISTVVVDGPHVDIMAEQGGSALKARVNLDFSDPSIPFSWYITARNADFRPWLPPMMSQDARNFAYLSATWNLRGVMQRWWESKGELEFKDFRLRYYSPISRSGQRLDFRSAYPAKIYFNGRDWVLENNQPITITSSMGEVRMGLKNHHPPSHLGMFFEGKIDIDALRTFAPGIETASGSVALLGAITGGIEAPNVDVSLKNHMDGNTPSDISLGFTGFRPSFQNIHLDAKIKSNGITVNKFTATKGNGTVSASGFLARPKSGEESDITVNLDNASFLYPFPIVKYFDSSVDGHIKITGADKPWTASGGLTIRKARSNRDIDIRDAILESLRSQSSVSSTDSITPALNLDINVIADKSIGFSSRSGQAQLSTDLRIGGTDISPSIAGLVEVSKGRFFYKRDFDIKRGLINFDDPVKADPALDISATSDVSSYRVGINITGRASAPRIDFTSDPPTRPDGTALSKMDIIALLNRGSLPESQSGQSTSESAAAAEALNLLAGQVEDTVQKIFDLSGQNVIRQVYIDTYADSEGTPVARFNLPLNITEDFDVILKVDKSNVKVSSEYSLHDSISLTGGIESSNDQSGTSSKSNVAPADTGVDLKFKFAFP